MLARPGIASEASSALAGAKAAKPSDLHLVIVSQGFDDTVQDHFDNAPGLFAGNLDYPGKPFSTRSAFIIVRGLCGTITVFDADPAASATFPASINARGGCHGRFL